MVTYDGYVDAVDFSWSAGYSWGRNKLLESDEAISSNKVRIFDITHLEKDYPRANTEILDSVYLPDGSKLTVKSNLTYDSTTNSSTVIFEGYTEREAGEYPPKYTVVNRSRELWNKYPKGTYSGRRNEILKQMISASCLYVNATTTNMSNGGSTTITFNGDKHIAHIATDFAKDDEFSWATSPVGAFHYGDFSTDSGIDISASNASLIKGSVRIEPSKIQYNKVRVLGGFTTAGVQCSATVQNSTSIDLIDEHPYFERDHTLTDNSACTDRANAILNLKLYQPKTVYCTWRDNTKGFVPPYQSLDFGYDTNSFEQVPEEAFIVGGTKYDLKNESNYFKLFSGIMIGEKTNDDLIKENQAHIQQVNTNVISNISKLNNMYKFVSREPSSADFSEGAMTINGAWQTSSNGLDISTIVSGAYAVMLSVAVRDNAATNTIRVRGPASSADYENVVTAQCAVANQWNFNSGGVVKPVNDRIDYVVTNACLFARISILGWWEDT